LSINTHIIGQKYIYIDKVQSTNIELAMLSNHSERPEGLVLRAGFQTGGKGQFENLWESNNNENLLLSILLKPDFLEIDQVFSLNIAISLAVKDTILFFFPNQAYIKWSNDIILNDKKVSGILIENNILEKKISKSIIGIGLNVLQQEFKNSSQATSLAIQDNLYTFDLELVYDKLISCLNFRYNELRSGWLVKQKNEYIQSLYKRNLDSVFISDQNEFHGKIIGIDSSGRLLIETEHGRQTYQNGQIKMRY
jgi:BirA family biotin operon repressor/biotin-[acetyl-CoA-carboxylase] ligase